MPKYLLKVRYSTDGIAGVRKDGGSARRDAASKLIASVGGTLESFHFAFGGTDVYAICEAPNNGAIANAATAVGASGAGSVETVALLTCEELDGAVANAVDYRAPGS